MTTCPTCSVALDWFARRRGAAFYRCAICGQRFKQFAPGGPLQSVRAHAVRRPDRPLTDEEITLIISSFDVTHRAMEQRLGIGRELIRRIRVGASYTERCPHLERWQAFDHRPTCKRCANWRPHPEHPCCAFGFPDPLQESTFFARECLHYQPTPCDCRSSVASTASGSQRQTLRSRFTSTTTATTAPTTAATPAARR